MWSVPAKFGCWLMPLYPLPDDAPQLERAHPISQASTARHLAVDPPIADLVMEATLIDCPEYTFTGKFDVNDGEGSE